MIEVRIRLDSEVEPVKIAKVPFNKLDDVIPTLLKWGVYADGGYREDLAGQIVVEGRAAFFEVIVSTEEAK